MFVERVTCGGHGWLREDILELLHDANPAETVNHSKTLHMTKDDNINLPQTLITHVTVNESQPFLTAN